MILHEPFDELFAVVDVVGDNDVLVLLLLLLLKLLLLLDVLVIVDV